VGAGRIAQRQRPDRVSAQTIRGPPERGITQGAGFRSGDDVVAMVCWLPTVQLNVHDEAHAAPSTVIDAPGGLLATACPVNGTKFAVMLLGPFITTSYENV